MAVLTAQYVSEELFLATAIHPRNPDVGKGWVVQDADVFNSRWILSQSSQSVSYTVRKYQVGSWGYA